MLYPLSYEGTKGFRPCQVSLSSVAGTISSQENRAPEFRRADEIREFSNGRAEILNIGGGEIGRLVCNRAGVGPMT